MSRLQKRPENNAIRQALDHALIATRNKATMIAPRGKAKSIAMTTWTANDPHGVANVIADSVPNRINQIESMMYSDNFRSIRQAIQRIVAKGQIGTMTNKEIGNKFRVHFKRHGHKWVVVPTADWEGMYAIQYRHVSPEEWARAIQARNDLATTIADAEDIMMVLINAANRLTSSTTQEFVAIF